MLKIILHFLTSPVCHNPRHIPNTPQLLWPHHQLASCLLKPMNHIQSLPAMNSWQHLILCITPCSFFLAPWQPTPLVVFTFLITPCPLLWELLPCHLPLLNWCPRGAIPDQLPFSCYMPRDLSYSCTSKYQLMAAKSFSSAQLSLLNSQAYTPRLTEILIGINHRHVNFITFLTELIIFPLTYSSFIYCKYGGLQQPNHSGWKLELHLSYTHLNRI